MFIASATLANVRFSGNIPTVGHYSVTHDKAPNIPGFDYKKADPYLTERQLKAFQSAESAWQDLYRSTILDRKLAAKESTPTQADMAHLKSQILALGIEIQELPEKPNHEKCAYTSWSSAKQMPVIHIPASYLRNPADSEDRRVGLQALSHEVLHALHYQRPSISPQKSPEAASTFEEIEEMLTEAMEGHTQPKNWPQVLENFMLQESLDDKSHNDLNDIKNGLMTEAAAYGLTAHLSGYDPIHKVRSGGYQAAIQIVNREIDDRATEALTGMLKRLRTDSSLSDSPARKAARNQGDRKCKPIASIDQTLAK